MTDEYLTPPNEAKIQRLYAFMSIDKDGNNGIVASILPGLGSTPLVTGSRTAVDLMIPVAQRVAKKTGVTIGLFAFRRESGEELWRSDE
jgi:hypothetical protein